MKTRTKIFFSVYNIAQLSLITTITISCLLFTCSIMTITYFTHQLHMYIQWQKWKERSLFPFFFFFILFYIFLHSKRCKDRCAKIFSKIRAQTCFRSDICFFFVFLRHQFIRKHRLTLSSLFLSRFERLTCRSTIMDIRVYSSNVSLITIVA